MKFQLVNHGWPINGGAMLIPTGTMLDGLDWKWQGVALPMPPPVNAAAMDQEAYDELRKHDPANRILIAGENINTGE
jgi:hypothetical protein